MFLLKIFVLESDLSTSPSTIWLISVRFFSNSGNWSTSNMGRVSLNPHPRSKTTPRILHSHDPCPHPQYHQGYTWTRTWPCITYVSAAVQKKKEETEENNQVMWLTKTALFLTGEEWQGPPFPWQETPIPPPNPMFSVAPFIFTYCHGLAVYHLMGWGRLLWLHLLQISLQSPLLLLGFNLAITPLTFPLIMTFTALSAGIKHPPMLPDRMPCFRVWVCLSCPQDFARHHCKGLMQYLFCWHRMLHNITSEQKIHFTAAVGLIQQ